MVSCKTTGRVFQEDWRSQLLNAIEKMWKMKTLGVKHDMDFIGIFQRMVAAEKTQFELVRK